MPPNEPTQARDALRAALRNGRDLLSRRTRLTKEMIGQPRPIDPTDRSAYNLRTETEERSAAERREAVVDRNARPPLGDRFRERFRTRAAGDPTKAHNSRSVLSKASEALKTGADRLDTIARSPESGRTEGKNAHYWRSVLSKASEALKTGADRLDTVARPPESGRTEGKNAHYWRSVLSKASEALKTGADRLDTVARPPHRPDPEIQAVPRKAQPQMSRSSVRSVTPEIDHTTAPPAHLDIIASYQNLEDHRLEKSFSLPAPRAGDTAERAPKLAGRAAQGPNRGLNPRDRSQERTRAR